MSTRLGARTAGRLAPPARVRETAEAEFGLDPIALPLWLGLEDLHDHIVLPYPIASFTPLILGGWRFC